MFYYLGRLSIFPVYYFKDLAQIRVMVVIMFILVFLPLLFCSFSSPAPDFATKNSGKLSAIK